MVPAPVSEVSGVRRSAARRGPVGSLFAGALVLGAVACSPGGAAGGAPAALPDAATPTWAEAVGPLVHRECVTCHRPQGPAPFSLVEYDDARKRARQIARVTASRYMPPWLPAAGDFPLAGRRRLDDEEIATLARWADGGAPAGDLAAFAPPRLPTGGWQLGDPDLVARMDEPYRLPAEGPDEYRNFVIRPALDGARWVAAVELQPDNPRAVHHARLLIDPTPASRRLDELDRAPGYGGMLAGAARTPEGHLLGWTPGKVHQGALEGLAWRLEPGTDLVLQLHMITTGKPEPVEASIGLHFTEEPPARRAVALVLGSRDIDLAPGDRSASVEASYVIPVDVDALAVYPHAHFLGRQMLVTAERQDEPRRVLLSIPEWNFDWQDEYRWEEPVPLRAGTRLVMRYTYDNSADNPRNPNDPPRRVTYGPRSTDEMAELFVQVVPREPAAAARIEADFERWRVLDAIDHRERMAELDPRDPAHPAAIGASWLHLGRFERALAPLERALALAPDHSVARNNLGFALLSLGRHERAASELRRAVAARPEHLEARFNLAEALRLAGDRTGALAEYRRILAVDDRLSGPLDGAARLLAARAEERGDPSAAGEAMALARRAVELTGGLDPGVLETLALAYAAAGRWAEAVSTLERAADVAPPEGTAALRARLDAYRRKASQRP